MERALLRMVLVGNEFIGGGRPLGDTLTEITRLGCEALGADMAGLTMTERRDRPRTAVYTDAKVLEIDEAQYQADRGPCLDAARERVVLRMVDAEVDGDRWPEFAEAARRHGVRTTLSVPVLVGDHSIGALNFYDRRAGYFGDDLDDPAAGFAGQMAIVAAYIEKAELADQMQQAMDSRATIEQAKGIIMATAGCSPDEAFDLLRQQSQAENRKLRDIAAELVTRQRRQPG
jgi:GAF domain-containing protein